MTPGPWNRLNWSFPLVTIGGLGGLLLVLLWTRTAHPWWALGRLLVVGGGGGALGALLWWLRRRHRKTR
jgi:hypothetical protein